MAPHFMAGGARLPIGSLAATLGLVLAVGLLAGVRATLTAPLLPALRGE